MNDEKLFDHIIVWKSVAFALAAPIFTKLLHLWLADSVSWGLGFFLSFVLFYETPPKVRVGSFFRAVLYSAAGGLMAGIGAYVSAR
jgi:hypothetical protein